MFIVNGLSDQLSLLVWSRISTGPFSLPSFCAQNLVCSTSFIDLLHPLRSNQPVLWTFISVFLSIGGVNSYNYLLMCTLFLNFMCSYLLFKRFTHGFFYSLIFTFSSHMWSHLGMHIALSQFWVFPLFVYLLLSLQHTYSKKAASSLVLFIVFATLISNYYGFFILLFCLVYAFSHVVAAVLSGTSVDFIFLRRFCGMVFVSALLLFLILLPYFRSTYTSTNTISKQDVTKPLEDFFTFSSRPWYFVLPPVKNPWLGTFSTNVLQKIAAGNYFLADDYFAGEHSGNFFGLSLGLLVSLVGFYTIFEASASVRHEVLLYLSAALLIFLITFPPFFTISGIKVWTPGYLIYKFFPMFRVTARLTILMLLIILLLLGICIDFIVSKVSKKNRFLLNLLVYIVTVVTLFETFIPPKIQKIIDPPKVYAYLGSKTAPVTNFAVYPYSSTRLAFFWLPIHRRYVMNTSDTATVDFDPRKFTASLVTADGLFVLKSLGGDYLVVSKAASFDDIAFFVSSDLLHLEEVFADSYLFKVI